MTALIAVMFFCLPLAEGKPKGEWYKEMDIGPAWSNTSGNYREEKRTAAPKGVLLGLGEDHKALFDTEALRPVAACKGSIEQAGTPWTEKHGILASQPDKNPVSNTISGPGWADSSGSFDDKRASLTMWIADEDSIMADAAVDSATSAGGFSVTATGGLKLRAMNGRLTGELPKGGEVTIRIAMSRGAAPKPGASPDFAVLVKGEALLYPGILDTDSPSVVDRIALPDDNP